MRTWIGEFSNDYAVPAEIEAIVTTNKLVDTSWHNDVCPSFSPCKPGRAGEDRLADPVVEAGVRIWIDHPDPASREGGEAAKRFVVTLDDENGNYLGDAIATDSLPELLHYLKDHWDI